MIQTEQTKSIYERKDDEQQKALQAWIDNKYKGTIIAATGVGKTRIMLLCAEALLANYSEKQKKSLNFFFISPLADLEDQIKSEAKKWDLYDKIIPYVEFHTIQKARNFKGIAVEAVFVDEVHLTLAIEKDTSARNFYLKNPIKHIAAFTATWPENKEYGMYLRTKAPKVYDLSFTEAKDMQLVSDYVLFKVPVTLHVGEQKLLNSANYMYNKCQYDLLDTVDPGLMFTRSKQILSDKTASKDEKRIAFLFMKAVRDRRSLINHAEKKFEGTVEAVKLLSSGKNKSRFLTFNGTIPLADSLTTRINRELGKKHGIRTKSYHSKLGVKARKEILDDFKTKRYTTGLNTVEAANAGLDVPDLEYIVLNSITSKGLTMIQRVGRAARWVDGKKAKVILFYVKDSQEERWMSRSLDSFEEVIDINDLSQMKQHL